MRQSEERFRSLIENALDIVTILEADGTVQYESPSVEKVLGYQSPDLAGKNLFEYIHPDDVDNTRHTFTNTIHNPDTALSIEFRRRHKDGSWRIFEAISQKFIDYEQTTRIVVNSRDITERKRLDEMRLALEREQELSALKIRFFSMASHEFRTPLSTILASAQILENCQPEGLTGEKIARNLNRIQSSVKDMAQLLNDILTINRAETGKLEFNPKFLDLEEFCQNLFEEIQLSTGSQHTITFSCQGQCNQAYLDEKLLRSILANLLSNAIKYSPLGSNVEFVLKCEQDNAILHIHWTLDKQRRKTGEINLHTNPAQLMIIRFLVLDNDNQAKGRGRRRAPKSLLPLMMIIILKYNSRFKWGDYQIMSMPT